MYAYCHAGFQLDLLLYYHFNTVWKGFVLFQATVEVFRYFLMPESQDWIFKCWSPFKYSRKYLFSTEGTGFIVFASSCLLSLNNYTWRNLSFLDGVWFRSKMSGYVLLMWYVIGRRMTRIETSGLQHLSLKKEVIPLLGNDFYLRFEKYFYVAVKSC